MINGHEVISKQYINLSGKQYNVIVRASGSIDISTSWEIPHPADAGSCHPRMVHRYASISQSGRLGKKIVSMLQPATV